MVDVDDVYDDSEAAVLLMIVEERYLAMLRAVHELVVAAFPERLPAFGLAFRLDDPSVRSLLAEAAERVVRIDDTTRQGIREQLQLGQQRGYSPWQIAHGVPKEGYRGIDGLFSTTWANRGEVIARTELAQAQVMATLNRYAATGFISRVRIHEAHDTDAPCAARADTVVPLSSRPMPLHPQCRMALSPIVDE